MKILLKVLQSGWFWIIFCGCLFTLPGVTMNALAALAILLAIFLVLSGVAWVIGKIIRTGVEAAQPRPREQPVIVQQPPAPYVKTKKDLAAEAEREMENDLALAALFPDEATRKAAEAQAQAKFRRVLSQLMR